MPPLRPIYARKRIDISWLHIINAVWSCLYPWSSKFRKLDLAALSQIWSPSQTLVTTSVRSAFDLALTAFAFPPGSEVLVSAVTIPDMIRIIHAHHLVPVPVDLQEDAAIDASAIEHLISPRTRAILVAHLFGSTRCSLNPVIISLACDNGLVVFEDCAQAFSGTDYVGDEHAEVSFFSFGTIKTCTALGGALATVRRAGLLEQMAEIQTKYPEQGKLWFLRKCIKMAVFKLITDNRWLYGMLIWGLRRWDWDHDQIVTQLGHSTNRNGEILPQIRTRPAPTVVRLLRRRLETFGAQYLRERGRRVERLFRDQNVPESFKPLGFSVPRAGNLHLKDHPQYTDPNGLHRTYWLCPIRFHNPDQALERLLDAGFDAASGSASMVVVDAAISTVVAQRENRPKMAVQIMSQIVYLPMDQDFDEQALTRLAEVLRQIEASEEFK